MSNELVELDPRYTEVESIGAGGMGSILKARDLKLDRVVAIKRPLITLVNREFLIHKIGQDGQIEQVGQSSHDKKDERNRSGQLHLAGNHRGGPSSHRHPAQKGNHRGQHDHQCQARVLLYVSVEFKAPR